MGLHLDLVLCSSSRRTTETLERIRPALGGTRIETESGLYGAGALELLVRLRRIADDVNSVMLIGHNPGVADLTHALVGDDEAVEDDPRFEKFPTAATAALSFTGHWHALESSIACLDSFWTPGPPS